MLFPTYPLLDLDFIPLPVEPVEMEKVNRTVLVIPSKDRPMQLDLTLRSFYKYCEDKDDLVAVVIYKASNLKFYDGYQILIQEYPFVNFIQEEGNFKNILNYVARSTEANCDDYRLV